ncbi:MAG: aldehyde dehydrogenase (NAD+), partial [Maribacter sp.]
MNLDFLKELGLEERNAGTSTGARAYESEADYIDSYSPVDGKYIGSVSVTTKAQYETVMDKASDAFQIWRKYTAP